MRGAMEQVAQSRIPSPRRETMTTAACRIPARARRQGVPREGSRRVSARARRQEVPWEGACRVTAQVQRQEAPGEGARRVTARAQRQETPQEGVSPPGRECYLTDLCPVMR